MHTYYTIYFFLYLFAVAVRGIYAVQAKKVGIKIRVKSFRESILVLIASPMMILPLFIIFSTWLDGFSMELPKGVIFLGAIGFGFAVLLHNWAHIHLGRFWTPKLEIREKQELIMTGPYKHVRHPMYAAFLLWSISQGFMLSNWLILVVGVPCFLILYLVRVDDEEKMMKQKFGKSYSEYMKRTGRIFPKFLS